MNREILFRGKNEKGIWHNGFYVQQPVEPGSWNEPPSYEKAHFIATLQSISLPFVEIIPGTLGQFTGLLDENGTKIFEGDIIIFYDEHLEENRIAHIGFRDGTFMLFDVKGGERITLWHDGEKEHYSVELLDFLESRDILDVKIIGNIHDNPELLQSAI